MKMSEFVQKIIRDFLIIFASIIIIITFLRQIYYPDMVFDLKSIYIIMAFSFISALIGFILYSPADLSEKKMRIRITFHFFALEIVLIALGSVFGIVNNAVDGIILALQIAVIYTLVRLLSWKKDKKEAQQINEKLKAFKKDV
jgi:DMSO reductase anchor subunit